jgi:hypothetical protein
MSIVTDAAHEMMLGLAERMEYELRAAWRAGYDYVHVYGDGPGDIRSVELDEQFSVTQYILPSNQKQPPRPQTREYRYTYDLTSVSDAEIREAIRR